MTPSGVEHTDLQLLIAAVLGRLKEAEIEQLGEKIADLAKPFATIDSFKKLYFGRLA